MLPCYSLMRRDQYRVRTLAAYAVLPHSGFCHSALSYCMRLALLRCSEAALARSQRVRTLELRVQSRAILRPPRSEAGGLDDRDRGTAVKRPRFSIGSGPGDFMPLVIGAVFLFISVPGFVLLLIENRRGFWRARFAGPGDIGRRCDTGTGLSH